MQGLRPPLKRCRWWLLCQTITSSQVSNNQSNTLLYKTHIGVEISVIKSQNCNVGLHQQQESRAKKKATSWMHFSMTTKLSWIGSLTSQSHTRWSTRWIQSIKMISKSWNEKDKNWKSLRRSFSFNSCLVWRSAKRKWRYSSETPIWMKHTTGLLSAKAISLQTMQNKHLVNWKSKVHSADSDKLDSCDSLEIYDKAPSK